MLVHTTPHTYRLSVPGACHPRCVPSLVRAIPGVCRPQCVLSPVHAIPCACRPQCVQCMPSPVHAVPGACHPLVHTAPAMPSQGSQQHIHHLYHSLVVGVSTWFVSPGRERGMSCAQWGFRGQLRSASRHSCRWSSWPLPSLVAHQAQPSTPPRGF